MGKDFILAFKPNSPRGKEYFLLFNRIEFEIQSFVPEWVRLPGFDLPQRAYMLDLKFLNTRERLILVTHIAQKFNLPVLEVDQRLETEGMPILDEDVTVIIHNPMRWL